MAFSNSDSRAVSHDGVGGHHLREELVNEPNDVLTLFRVPQDVGSAQSAVGSRAPPGPSWVGAIDEGNGGSRKQMESGKMGV